MVADVFVEGARYRASDGRHVKVVSRTDKGWLTFQDSKKRKYRRRIMSRRPMSGYTDEYVIWERSGSKNPHVAPKAWIEAHNRVW